MEQQLQLLLVSKVNPTALYGVVSEGKESIQSWHNKAAEMSE